MRQTAISLAIFLASLDASAAAFFGSVVVDGQLPGRAIPIELVCANTVIATETIDARGTYRFTNVPARTNCVVRIEGATAPVALYPSPTRFDYALTHSAGRAVLTQR